MNRYLISQSPYLIKKASTQSDNNIQDFQYCQDSVDCIQNSDHQNQNQQQYLPSVRKYLSQPNQLMNKIQFVSYCPKWYYPRPINKLPKCLQDYQSSNYDKNNINNIMESVKGHEKYKQNLNNLISSIKDHNKINTNKIQNTNNINIVPNQKMQSNHVKHQNLISLHQYYQNKSLIYQKYNSQYQMKLQQNKLKLKYFATYVIDMAIIFKKQIKIQQNKTKINNPNTNINKLQKIQKNNLINLNKNKKQSNFIIRQTKSNINQQNNNLVCQKSNINHVQNQSLPSFLPTFNKNIQFDSNFQSGNLFQVYQKSHNQYDLILQNDINTKGNTQWFFFSIKGAIKNTNIKINIVNLSKSDSLFNIGMKPTIFSMMRYQKRNIGWVRQGSNIQYQANQQIHKQCSSKSSKSPYYRLSFEYKFIYDGDIVYFSHSIPYTYSDLSSYMQKITSDKQKQQYMRLKNLGYTIGGNQVDLIQITNSKQNNKNKKVVWIIARQHPGQTNSGFILEGIIGSLLSGNEHTKILLNNFIFKIIPMLNIDGVIHGNTRAEFIGADPNRKWSYPNKLHNPIIHSIKHYIEKDKNNIEMILDLHSHSRKLGTFFYGNTLEQNSVASRIYPLLVCKKDSRFTYKYCRFTGGGYTTARYSLYQTLKIPLIYTIQSSFYGYQHENDHKIITYQTKDYKEMGSTLMLSFLDYQIKKNKKYLKFNYLTEKNTSPQEQQNNINHNSYSQQQELHRLFQAQLNHHQQTNLQHQQYDSDSDPQSDEYNEKQFKKLIMYKQKKKKKKIKKISKIQQKPKKQIKQSQTPKIQKIKKKNYSQSYYKDYFSRNRIKCNMQNKQKILLNQLQSNIKIKKQTYNIGIQVQLSLRSLKSSLISKENHNILHSNNGILTQRNQSYQYSATAIKQNNNSAINNANLNKPLPITINSLCVIGQKLQEIQIYENTIGIQVEITQNKQKQIFISRNENNQSAASTTRKSFSVRTRTNSFLHVKQNNFLQRGDFVNKNYCAKK